VLTSLTQCVAQLLVLADGLGQLALGLQQALLERAHPLGGIEQLAAQVDDLFLETLGLLAQVPDLGLVLRLASGELVRVHSLTSSGKLLLRRNLQRSCERHAVDRGSSSSCCARCVRSGGDPRKVPSLPADGAVRHSEHPVGRDDNMKVWIDQDLCTGDGLCEEIAPDVFTLLDDGLAYVREGSKIFATAQGNPQGAEGMANIPDNQLDAVIESAEECPGECIFIEP
jgi:ferredoxin